MLSLSQFTHSLALTFLTLIGFLLHVRLHFPLAGGCGGDLLLWAATRTSFLIR